MKLSNEVKKTACIILSGGNSSRMKTHKALLPFSQNKNFLQHIIGVYLNTGLSDIVVVKNEDINLNPKQYPNATIINNNHPEKGRIYSIQLGLQQLSEHTDCFIQNIDNPFVTKQLLSDLLKHQNKADFISPVYYDKGGHPVLLSGIILNKIRTITDNKTTLRDILSDFNRYKVVTNDERCILNINTPDDYSQYFSFNQKPAILS